jgi:hypothetical protein
MGAWAFGFIIDAAWLTGFIPLLLALAVALPAIVAVDTRITDAASAER